MMEQRKQLHYKNIEWMGQEEQLDDMLVMGFRI
jgi:hypothetical protein